MPAPTTRPRQSVDQERADPRVSGPVTMTNALNSNEVRWNVQRLLRKV